jgi:hypothetical protein
MQVMQVQYQEENECESKNKNNNNNINKNKIIKIQETQEQRELLNALSFTDHILLRVYWGLDGLIRGLYHLDKTRNLKPSMMLFNLIESELEKDKIYDFCCNANLIGNTDWTEHFLNIKNCKDSDQLIFYFYVYNYLETMNKNYKGERILRVMMDVKKIFEYYFNLN